MGFVVVFFLPGFAWTLVFFRRLNIIERIVFSLALSMVVVTFSILFVNMVLGISITGLSAALTIIVVTVLPVAGYYLNRFIRRKSGRAA